MPARDLMRVLCRLGGTAITAWPFSRAVTCADPCVESGTPRSLARLSMPALDNAAFEIPPYENSIVGEREPRLPEKRIAIYLSLEPEICRMFCWRSE